MNAVRSSASHSVPCPPHTLMFLRMAALSLLVALGLGVQSFAQDTPQAMSAPAHLPSAIATPQSAIGSLQSAIPLVDSEWLIVVQRNRQRITLYQQGREVKSYTVSTGKAETITPLGWWKIVDKYPVSPAGIYGTRWLGWERWNPRAGRYEWYPESPPFGIHGTNEPDKIGTAVSSGCVRLLNQDVEELYGMIPVGTYVLVVE